MDKQTVQATAISAAITLIVTLAIGWFVGVFEAGSKALTDKQIEALIDKHIAERHQHSTADISVMQTEVSAIKGSITRIENRLEDNQREIINLLREMPR